MTTGFHTNAALGPADPNVWGSGLDLGVHDDKQACTRNVQTGKTSMRTGHASIQKIKKN